MKKIISVSAVSTLMVLGLGSSAFAIHGSIPAETSQVVATKGVTIGLDGNVRMRGYWQEDTQNHNVARNPDNETVSEEKTGYDGRVRFGVTGKTSDTVTGYIQLESGDRSSDTYTWGNGTSSGLNSGGSKQSDGDTDLSILQAWIQYSDGTYGLKVGHMPLALGNKVFFDHTGSGDDAIVVFYNPTGMTHIGALAIKFEEGSSLVQDGDDINGYVGLVTHKFGDALAVGANYTYLDAGSDEPTVPNLEFSNLGLTADGKVGSLSYMGDVEWQFGQISDTMDQDAFAVLLGGALDLGGSTSVGLTFGYGTGNDATSSSTDNENFTNFLTDTTYQLVIPGYRFAVPGQGSKNTGLANLTMYQVNAKTKTVCPVTSKDLALEGRVSYVTLTEDVAVGSTMEDEIGWEAALFADWKLSNGLTYKIEAAYLFAGDAWGSDPENGVFVRNGLELSF